MIVRSASTPSSSWAPPRATRKPEITSSRISSAPCSSASRRSSARKPSTGGTTPMFAGSGSARIAATSCSASAAATASASFHGDDDRRRGLRLGDAGARRDALGREPRARLGEQAVDVAVIGAGELDQLLAPGCRAREAHGAHRRLGARVDHPHHLDRREAVADLGGELDLALGRGAVAGALRGGLGDRLDDRRMRVAADQRAPRADPVDVAMAVDVDQLEALAAIDEDRVLAADRAHRPHGGVDPAREQADGAGVEDFELRVSIAGRIRQARSGLIALTRSPLPTPRSRR